MRSVLRFILSIIVIFNAGVRADEVAIEVIKHSESKYILVNYQFSYAVSRLSFSNTPSNFIKDYWEVKQRGQKVNLVDKSLEFSKPTDQITFKIHEGFDTSEMMAYKPYLNFNDNYAIFTQYFIPSGLVYSDRPDVNTVNHLSYDLKTKYTLNKKLYSLNKFFQRFDGLNNYLLLKDVSKVGDDSISIIIDSSLPSETSDLIVSFSNKILNYYSAKFKKDYPKSLQVLVDYDDSKDYLSFEGGALDGQIILTLAGKEIHKNPLKYKSEILFTLAHEAAHLWNAFVWRNNSSAPSWLYEGSADYLAYEALLSLQSIPQSHYDFFLSTQYEECESALKQKALNNVDNTEYFFAAYSCGRIIFHAMSYQFNENDQFDFWNKFVRSSPVSGYSIEEFKNLMTTNSKTNKLYDDFKKVTTSEQHALGAFRMLVGSIDIISTKK